MTSRQTPSAAHAAPASVLRPFLAKAIERRRALLPRLRSETFRIFSGAPDGMQGVFVDVYGAGAVMIMYEGQAPRAFDPAVEGAAALELLSPLGVRAVYYKPFAKDRSKLGGQLPPVVTAAAPAAGDTLPEAITIRELDWTLEIRLYDGLSTGLFLDQRENRGWVARLAAKRAGAGTPPSILNTFAYTCAFSVAAAMGGAATTSVDVSARYLEWGKRNFTHSGLDPAQHRFARMDTFEFLGYARRKGLRYDLVILDPPSFAAGNKRKGIRPWSSIDDYARLVKDASDVLAPGGAILASTNTHELCRQGRLEREIVRGLGRPPKWLELPAPPADFATEHDRFSARAFTL